MATDTLSMLVTGDFVINQSYDTSTIDPALVDLFRQSDINIVNLEAPITTSSSKILKTGPHLKSDENNTLKVLKLLNIDIVTLANNHILDYNEKGVSDTLDFCKKNTFQTVGAGMNIKKASKTSYIKTKVGVLSIINFAENEWASATSNFAGANPMCIIENTNQIKEAKKKSDFVFVIIHGGHEYYNLPSPRIQKQYRFYADQGADIIVGHHTHCISGYEEYNGVPIYYSLGNFLFTNKSNYEDWLTGLVLEIKIINKKIFSTLHPVRQDKENFALKILVKNEKKIVLNRILEFNKIISKSDRLFNEWNQFITQKYNSYLSRWSPLSFIRNRYLQAVFIKFGVKAINKKGLAIKLNLIRCEAHLDFSKEIIQKYLNK